MDDSLAQALPAFMDFGSLNASCGIVLDQFRRKEMVHAYLLTGARGLGKATFAKVLACALFCTSEQKPCGHCDECKRVLRGANPDVIQVAPEGDKQIGVDRVREVVESISQHAFGAGHRVVMVEPVEKLTPQAQNCLLKSLEEPVSHVVFLLLAHELTALLGTIASRCARVKLTPWPDAAMKATLKQLGYEEPSVARILPLCSGNIGQAIDLLVDKTQDQELQTWVNKALTSASDADVVSISTSLREDREGAARYLSALERALHQALLVKTGQLPLSALDGYASPWQDSVAVATVEGLTGLMRSVAEARKLKASQVNWQSTIDHLMIKILGERKRWRQLSA